MTDISIVQESPNQPDVLDLLAQSDRLMAELYPAESNHMLDVSELEKPDVTFLVARYDGRIVGCAALVAYDNWGEVKRMFVDPSARGLKLGLRLMEALVAQGQTLGMTALRLELGAEQPEAMGLYRRFGFVECRPFGDYVEDPLSIFMEKRLDG